jgi:hypothetical protein
MKKILNLTKAALLKKNLDEKAGSISIDKDNILIEEQNTIRSNEEREIDIEEIENKKELKSDLILRLYIAIQTANLKKLKGDSHENAWYIKKLSQLEQEKFHLLKIKKADTKKKEESEEKVKVLSFIKLKDILKRTERIEKDIQEIKDKIAKFNKEVNISIEITPEMNEFIKSVEN